MKTNMTNRVRRQLTRCFEPARVRLLVALTVLCLFGIVAPVTQAQDQPSFTKITTGPVVEDRGDNWSGSWGDFNNDGYLDLFVARRTGPTNSLYVNNRDGTFSRISSGPVVQDRGQSMTCAWGDFDNDGWLDLFIANGAGGSTPTGTDFLFRNLGSNAFARVGGPTETAGGDSQSATWSDIDNDGFLDLFVANNNQRRHLFRNRGASQFDRITTGALVTDITLAMGAAWADYDNDGDADLFIPNGAEVQSQNANLYRNEGGTFTKLAQPPVTTDSGHAVSAVWADYDNDGDFDLFVGKGIAEGPFMYRNDGAAFVRVLDGPIATAQTEGFTPAAAGDYDNDGFIDLFATSGGPTRQGTNALFHNNGDGTFSKIITGPLVSESGYSGSASWADYDNDGFLDLLVCNMAPFSNQSLRQTNFLYHNDANVLNGWLKVRLVGLASNRAGIGAKVRVKATIRGQEQRQLRQIGGGDGAVNTGSLEAHFGLGDATNVDWVRIEWPSGILQELTNVAPKQILTVVEAQDAPDRSSRIVSSGWATNGTFQVSAAAAQDLRCVLEATTDLVTWTKVAVRRSQAGAVQFEDPHATNHLIRFYRIAVP
jgi:hypothetical protein